MNTEEGSPERTRQVASRLSDLRGLLERLTGELALGRYRADAGLETEAWLGGVIEKHSVLLDPAILDLLSEEAEKAEEEERGRIAELRRAILFLQVDESVRDTVDRLRDLVAQSKLWTGDEEVPFLGSAHRIGREPDRRKRSVLARARERAIDGWGPVLLERISRLDRKARDLGYGGYGDLLRRESGIDLAALEGLAGEFLVRTQEVYREVLSWLLKDRLEIDPAESEHQDLIRTFRGEEFDALFPAEKVIPALADFTRSLQIDLQAEGRVEIDLDDRPGKRSRPFYAAAKIPDRIILCSPPAGGHAHYRALMHALGHTLHRAYTGEGLPFEWRVLGDRSVTEAFAFLFEGLVHNPRWMRRYLSVEQPEPFAVFADAHRLYRLRRTAALYRYEWKFYAEKPSPKGADVYRVGLSEGCLSMFPRALYLHDLSPHLYSARHLRGRILAGMLQRHLVHYFEADWYRNPRAGQFLIRLWRQGQESSAEKVASQIGYPALDPQPLVETLEKRF